MAIHALLKCERLFEISIRMAAAARHLIVFALQGKRRPGMVKVAAQRAAGNSLPAAGVVARLATLLSKTSTMRIGVAVRALAEWNARITRFAGAIRRMALFALHAGMHSREGESRFGMIKLGNVRALPRRRIMATLAGIAQPPLMRVLMAGDARGGYPQKRLVQILYFDARAFRCRDMLRCMALRAVRRSVLALEHVAGFAVIECLDVPLDQRKVPPIVLGVAARTLLARLACQFVSRMQSLVGGNAGGDLRMALLAAKVGSTRPQLMA